MIHIPLFCPIEFGMYYRMYANPFLLMSSETINAERALDVAKNFLGKAGYGYYFIDEVRKDDGNWIVRARTLGPNEYVMKISESGEILEFGTSKNR